MLVVSAVSVVLLRAGVQGVVAVVFVRFGVGGVRGSFAGMRIGGSLAVGVDIIRTLTTRPVIAIDVRTPIKPDLGLSETEEPATLLSKVSTLFGRNSGETVDILAQSYTITQDRLIQLTMALHPPDLLLTPNLPQDLGSQSFDWAEEAMEIGYRDTQAALSRLDTDSGNPANNLL